MLRSEIQNEKELRIFNVWRKGIAKKLPDLTSRVFALRDESYWGHGFHYSLEFDLGQIISMANDYRRDYRDLFERISAEANYMAFLGRLTEIEQEIKPERYMKILEGRV